MAGHHYFARLRAHAEKEYKFKQGRSLGNLRTPEDTQGECLGLALMWVQQVISSTRTSNLQAAMGLDFFTPIRGHLMATHALNEGAVKKAYGMRAGAGNLAGQLHQLEGALGLASLAHSQPARAVQTGGYDLRTSMANLIRNLAPGEAACARFDASRGGAASPGHAVAVYRSRGSKVHFFDANAGAYEVIDVDPFIGAWIAAYQAQGLTLDVQLLSGNPGSWNSIYAHR